MGLDLDINFVQGPSSAHSYATACTATRLCDATQYTYSGCGACVAVDRKARARVGYLPAVARVCHNGESRKVDNSGAARIL